MKFLQAACSAILFATIAWTGIAHADGEGIGSPDGSYRGGGYRVTVSAGIGDYIGFDRQGRKLVIPGKGSGGADKTREWTNKGYTYRLTGIGQPQTNDGDYSRVMLTIVNPQGRVILNQMMNRVK